MATVVSPIAEVAILEAGWLVYEAFGADLRDGDRSRMAYDGALLEIMSPSQKHEIYNRLLEMLAREVGRQWNIEVLGSGSTTLKIKPRGAEPDSSFYTAERAALMRNREIIDLTQDPPPDIVVEIDISRERVRRPMLARLRSHA